jgi:hypothetical protein
MRRRRVRRGGAVEKKRKESVFTSAWSSLRELVWPRKPRRCAESQPIPIVNRMAAGRSYRSMAWAVGRMAVAILLILYLVKSRSLRRRRRSRAVELAVLRNAPVKSKRWVVVVDSAGRHW